MAGENNGGGGGAVASHADVISGVLSHQTTRAQITRALSGVMDPNKFLTTVMTEIRSNPKLAACDPDSIVLAVTRAAQIGLDPDRSLAQVAFVPRWSSKTRGDECTLQIMYGGMITLASEAGIFEDVSVGVVYPGDEFRVFEGTSPKIEHVPHADPYEFDEDAWTHVYCVGFLSNGRAKHYVMTRAQAAYHRDRYAPRNREKEIVGPWVSNFLQMAQKTTIRMMWKTLPKPRDNARAERMRRALEFDEAVPVKAKEVASRQHDPKSDAAAEATSRAVTDLVSSTGRPAGAASASEEESPAAESQGSSGGDHPLDPPKDSSKGPAPAKKASKPLQQQIAVAAKKLFQGATDEEIPTLLAEREWAWNRGAVSYQVASLADVPDTDAREMLKELVSLLD